MEITEIKVIVIVVCTIGLLLYGYSVLDNSAKQNYSFDSSKYSKCYFYEGPLELDNALPTASAYATLLNKTPYLEDRAVCFKD